MPSMTHSLSSQPSVSKGMLNQQRSWEVEVIPDSEEERPRGTVQKVSFAHREVIELSSDSSDEDDIYPSQSSQSRGPSQLGKSGSSSSKAPVTPSRTCRNKYMRSRIIESSDSDSSDEESPGPPTKLSLKLASTTWNQPVPKADPKVLLEKTSAVNTVIEDEDDDTDAILVFNEPKSARKPLPSHSIARSLAGDTTSKPSQATSDAPTASTSCKIGTPSRTPAKGTPRTSKKKTQAEQQKKLQDYADALFKELNGTVFNGGLPDDTKLNWNKRLLTTAGRAKWHRSRDGVASSEIELAEKILTSFERIRNTLSHEMCHLASWVIDKEIKEGHGRIWKAWTRRVMSKYPNIEISTRHDYEIDYPFQWKCGKCAKIYGRFSKSIKTEECVCGACKVGRLVPQFETNTRTHRTQIMSRMASVKGQDSPCRSPIQTSVKPPVIICISSDSEDDEPTIGRPTKATCCDIDGAGTDSDSEVEVLAMVLQSTSISSA